MTYCPQYPGSLEQQDIEKKLYQQSLIEKLLSKNCVNNEFQLKGLKRDVSNLNKYMYLIHKQSSKAKMKIEKENSYYKSAKISGNVSYYNTFLCTTTNKFVLNTYALNHTQGDNLTGKKKHYEQINLCCKNHKHAYDSEKDKDTEIEFFVNDNVYTNNYLKNLNQNRNSKRKSNEITRKNTVCQKCKGTRKIDRKEGKQKEVSECNNTNQGYSNTVRNISMEKLSLINSRFNDLNKGVKEGIENVSEVNLPLNRVKEGQKKHMNNNVNKKEEIRFDTAELSTIKNNEIQENHFDQYKHEEYLPIDYSLYLKEQALITKIQRSWRLYKIIKSVIKIQRSFRFYLYNSLPRHSKTIYDNVGSNNMKLISKILLNNPYEFSISSLSRLIRNVIKIQKYYRKYIFLKNLKIHNFLNENIGKIQKMWRNYSASKKVYQKYSEFVENAHTKKENIIIKIPIVLKNNKSLLEESKKINDKSNCFPTTTKELGETYELANEIVPLLNSNFQRETKDVSKEKSIVHNAIDYSTEFSNNLTRQNDETSLNKYIKNGKSIYIGLKKPKNLRVIQNKNLKSINHNLKEHSNNPESHSNEENLSNYSNINKSHINSLSIFPDLTINSRYDKHLLTSSMNFNEYPNISNDRDDKNLTESAKDFSEYSKILSVKNHEVNVLTYTPETYYYEERINLLSLPSITCNNIVNHKKPCITILRVFTLNSTNIHSFTDSKQVGNNSTIMYPEGLENHHVQLKNFFYNDNNSYFTKVVKSNYHSKNAKIIQQLCVKKKDDIKLSSNNTEGMDRKVYTRKQINLNNDKEIKLTNEQKSDRLEAKNDLYCYKYHIYEYKIIKSSNIAKENKLDHIVTENIPTNLIISEELNNDIQPKFNDLSKQNNTDFFLEKSEELVKTNEYDKMRLKFKNLLNKLKKNQVDRSISVENIGEKEA